MFRLAVLFLCVALAAAFVGFGGVANYSWEGARVLFIAFLFLSVIAFGHGWVNGPAIR